MWNSPFYLLLKMCVSPARGAGGAASCRAGEHAGRCWPSSSWGVGTPQPSASCPGRERRSCGCGPAQRGRLPPGPASHWAAPAPRGWVQGGARLQPRQECCWKSQAVRQARSDGARQVGGCRLW